MAIKPKKLIRKLYIVGTIDEEAYLEFSKSLSELERANPKATVELEINSAGGVAYDALAFAGRIRSSSCPIHIKAYGVVASAAVLVLAAGTHREMTREGWLMVHEDSGELNGNVVTLERESAHLRRMERQWAQLLETLTGTSAAEWERLHRKTTYLTAEQCLKLGIIDGVL